MVSLLEAERSIHFKDGFHAQAGCSMYANNVEKKVDNNFLLYPNPSSNQFTITSNEKVENIEIFDVSGTKMTHFQISSDSKSYYISHSFSKGIYIVHARIVNEIVVKQIVVL